MIAMEEEDPVDFGLQKKLYEKNMVRSLFQKMKDKFTDLEGLFSFSDKGMETTVDYLRGAT